MLVELFGGHDPTLEDLYRSVLGPRPRGARFRSSRFTRASSPTSVGDEARVDRDGAALRPRARAGPRLVVRRVPAPRARRHRRQIRCHVDGRALSTTRSSRTPACSTPVVVSTPDCRSTTFSVASPPSPATSRPPSVTRRTPWRWPAPCRRRRCSCTASIISATRSPCSATTLPTLIGTEAAALAATVGVERSGRVPARHGSAMTAVGPRRCVETPPAGRSRRRIGAATLPDSTGLGQLARLLSTPGVEVPASSWPGDRAHRSAADLGPALDAQAKRAYRQRLLELQAEVDDAAAGNDPVRGRAGARRDRRSPARAGTGGRPRRPRPPERLRRRTGSGQRGAQPQAGDHRRQAAGSRSRGAPRGQRCAPVVTAPTFRSRRPPCGGSWRPERARNQ